MSENVLPVFSSRSFMVSRLYLFILKINLFILFYYLFLAALGLRCCMQVFSSCSEWGLLCCGERASHCGGFSCCGAWALGSRASVVVARGL